MIFSWTWQRSRGQRFRILLACLCGIVRVGIGLAFVWTSKLLVDAATSDGNTDERIVSLSILLVSLLIVEMLFSFATTYLSNQTEIRMKNRLRADIYNHLLSSRWDKLGSLHSGDLLNRITEDVRVVCDVVCSNLPLVIVMLFQLVAAFVMLYLMDWTLALCVVCIMPFFLLISKVYIKKTRRLTADIRRSDSGIQTNLQEGLQHHVVVQSLECEDMMRSRLGDLQQTLYGQTMHRTRFGIFSRSMLRIGFIACYATAFLWSVWHLHSGLMTYGMMTAFLQLVARIQNPMVSMSQLIPGFVHAMSSIDRLHELEQLPSEDKGTPELLGAPVGIRIDNLSFQYNAESRLIFNHFSYDFRPGSKTVVMGETGVGKSTLVRLLLALLRPTDGNIYIYNKVSEGTDTASGSQSADNTEQVENQIRISASTRCNMVYVPQGNTLLEGTVRDNLLLGNPSATEEQMRDALHTAVADFVFDLPRGLDTHCGELGKGLSEGQAQRISIARALLRQGSILLLDEFNSSLDEATAHTLMQRLLDRRRQSTIIFISHRPEVASHCDATLHLTRS